MPKATQLRAPELGLSPQMRWAPSPPPSLSPSRGLTQPPQGKWVGSSQNTELFCLRGAGSSSRPGAWMTSQGFRPTQCDLKFHVTPGLFSEQSKQARGGSGGRVCSKDGGGGKGVLWTLDAREKKGAPGFFQKRKKKKKKSPSQEGRNIFWLGTPSAKGSLTLWLWARVRGQTVWRESRSLG